MNKISYIYRIKKSIFIISIFSVTCTYCNNSGRKEELKNGNPVKISINNIPEKKVIRYSELFDSVGIVKLETTKESLIGRIDKMIFYHNIYLILDIVQSKSVLAFDSNGKFLRKIGKNGKGPGEYIEPSDVVVDQFSDKIIIYDGRKLLFYDLKGNFLEAINLVSHITSFSILDKDIFACYFDCSGIIKDPRRSQYNLSIINKRGKVLNNAFKIEDFIYPSLGSRRFFNSNYSELLVLPGYSNTIYKISLQSVVPKFIIDFGKYTIPNEFFLSAKTDQIFDQKLKKSSFAFLLDYFETPNYLAFSFVYKRMIYNCFYSKKTGALKFGNSSVNNMYGLISSLLVSSTYGDRVVSYYDPSNIDTMKKILNSSGTDSKKLKTELIKWVETWPQSDEQKSIYKKVVEETIFNPTKEEIEKINSIGSLDNPVLIVQKLKDF